MCFFYYCFFLPFIWLGKKIWWGVFKDTAAKKEAAEKAVLNQAKKKGKLEKYGIIDIAAELKNIEKERNELRGEDGDKQQQDDTTSYQNAEMMCSARENVKQIVAESVGLEKLKSGGDKTDSKKSKEDGKKQPSKTDKDKNSKAKSDRKETKETIELKKEKQSVGKCMTGGRDTEKNVKLEKEKQLEEGAREMKNTDEKPKEKGEGVKQNNQVKGMEKSVELKKEKQLGEGMRPNDQKCERRKELPLKKESPGYREGSRAQERTAGRNAVDSGMKSSQQRSPSKSQDDKRMCERSKMPKGPRKSAVKAKQLRIPQSAKSTATSHGYAQHGRLQSSAKSEESLSPMQREVSHANKGSEASITKLNDDTITKSESAHDGRQDSHTSLASVDHRDDKSENKVEAEISISSQEGSPRRKASAGEIKSDMSGKNLEPKPSDTSPVSDPDRGSKQSLGAVSPHHSEEEIKPVPSDKSEVADPVLSQHSDMVMKSHHSEATPSQQPISSQHSVGTLPRTGPGEISSGSDNDMKRSISRESSVRVQRVSSDQFAVRYLSEGRISVTMQSSHHSRNSDTRAAHSRSEAEFSKCHQSGSSVERRSLSVSALISPKSSGSSKVSMYSDPPLTTSFSSNSSNTASTRSSSDSTNMDSKKSTAPTSAKSVSTSSATSNSSSDSATGTNSSTSGQTSSSSSDLTSKSGDSSRRTPSNQWLESDASSTGSHTSGMVPSGSDHSENFDESESNTVLSHHSEAESRSETAHSDKNEEFHDDEHTSNSGSEQDSSAESSSGSHESHSEITSSESQESYTSSSTSQHSTTTYFSSYSSGEGSISRSHPESARSMSSVSASSSQTSHSE